jgi:hypothetical protein
MVKETEAAAHTAVVALRVARENAVPFAMGGAALYGIGFLIVNSYLSSLGVLELELIRPRYLVVAVLFLTLFGAPIVLCELFTPIENRSRWRNQIVGAIEALIVVVVLEIFSAYGIAAGLVTEPLSLAMVLLVANGALLLLWLVVKRSYAGAAHGLLMVAPLAVLFVLVIYSQVFYRLIPRWIGGGLAEPVAIVLTPEARAECEGCSGLKFIVDEDQERLVLLQAQEGGRARVLSRQHVIAVIYGAR